MTSASIAPPLSGGVLVASPSNSLRERVLDSFHDHRWRVQEALGGAEALVKLETGDWQVLYLDRRLPDLDADELIAIIKRRFPGIQVFLLDSDCGQPAAGVQTPLSRERAGLPGTAALEEAVPLALPLPGMIGKSAGMQRLYRLARLVAPRRTTVLISGATGTGKELVARAIHQLSSRAARPFAVINCAAIPESLLESELFGHVRGAFTGAVQSYSGRIHAAQGGTLFLDEVGELPLSLQPKLLRFLEQREVQRLGSTETVRLDVRVLAATNRDLVECVEQGSFRDDLFYRLAAFPLELPPLSERVGDIPKLAEHFLSVAASIEQSPAPLLSREALGTLQAHRWPGNVRELQQVMERAAILVQGRRTILPEHLYFAGMGRREQIAARKGL